MIGFSSLLLLNLALSPGGVATSQALHPAFSTDGPRAEPHRALMAEAPGEGLPTPDLASPPIRWGAKGHQMAARTAHANLPDGVPGFFREAGDQIEWLNPEPDRWRDDGAREMNEGYRYDHYMDIENAPPGALNAPDRWAFVEALYTGGVENPHRDVGFVFYRILELHQRVANGFARWRSEPDPRTRRWIEERIVNDAGILGHYVTDISNPHHTTIHFNGWDEEKVPNPGGFATDGGTHARFESRFVEAHVELSDVMGALPEGAEVLTDARGAVLALLLQSNAEVYRLYELDRDVGFAPDRAPQPEAKEFAVERLAAGARLLRDLWWTAWVMSEEG